MAFDLKKASVGLSKKLKKSEDRKMSAEKPANTTGALKIDIKNPKFLGSLLLGLLLLFVVTMGVGIYGFNWEDRFTNGVTGVLPYPAAIVNGRVITYHQYLEQLSIVKEYQINFKQVDFKSEEGKALLSDIRKDTMDRLVEDGIVASQAVKLKVTVSDKELNEQFDQLVTSNGGETSFANVLDQYYDLTPAQFKNMIYKSRLLRQKVAEKFANDDSMNSEAKAKAEEVLAKVKAGEDFASLAKQYSQDTTASAGGDLGFFSKGKMVPEFETAAFALKAGETSEIVKTVYGYHIIKVVEVKGEEIQASHILIKTKDFNTWLADAVKTAKVTNYIKTSK